MNKRRLLLAVVFLLILSMLPACTNESGSKDEELPASQIEQISSEETETAENENTSAAETSGDVITNSTVSSDGSSELLSSSQQSSNVSSKRSEASSKTSSKASPEVSKKNTSSVQTAKSNAQQSSSTAQASKNQASAVKSSKPASQTGTQTASAPSVNPSPQPAPQPAVDNSSVGDINLFNSLFNLANRVTVSIDIPKTELDKLQNDYYTYKRKKSKSPIYRKADMTVTVNGQSYTIKEVGIRLKGNMSLTPVFDQSGAQNISHYKISFNETFDDKDYYGSEAKVWASSEERKQRKNRRFATLKKMDIKWNSCYDDTQIREIYASEMFSENGVLAQKIGLTQFVMNGANFGVLKIYEPVDELFLEKHLPESALGGDLYKCGWTMKPCNYVANQVTFGVDDKDTGAKFNFNLKTNEKSSNHSALVNMLNVINSRTDRASIDSVVDTEYFANFLAASYFAGDPDDIRNNYNNHYIYFRKDNGKAIFIPYDNDRTLGLTYGYNPDKTGMTKPSPYSGRAEGAGNSQANPLIKSAILSSNAFLTDEYEAALKRIADSGRLDVNRFNSVYETARNNYQSVVTPGIYFANQELNFAFSLDGGYSTNDWSNMSFSEYSRRILETYHKELG